MSTTYTPNVKLGQPALGDTGWSTPLNNNCTTLDGLAPVGGLAVSLHEVPSASLTVAVAAGNYVQQDGTVGTYAGTSSQAIAASSTKVLYLDLTASGALTVAASFPLTAHVRLATVVTGSSAVTSITDNRQTFDVCGSIVDGVNWTFGTTTGTQIGTAVSQKIGLWGVTPVVQPLGANQAAITDSTGGTASFTLAATTATNSSDQSGPINNNFASLARQLAAIRTALVAAGVMKGSS
jgi:hypothetical protein